VKNFEFVEKYVFNGIFPVSSSLPVSTTKTLASVPAPRSVDVFTVIAYSTTCAAEIHGRLHKMPGDTSIVEQQLVAPAHASSGRPPLLLPRQRHQIAADLPVAVLGRQPLLAGEDETIVEVDYSSNPNDVRFGLARALELDPVQVPGGAEAAVVVPDVQLDDAANDGRVEREDVLVGALESGRNGNMEQRRTCCD